MVYVVAYSQENAKHLKIVCLEKNVNLKVKSEKSACIISNTTDLKLQYAYI